MRFESLHLECYGPFTDRRLVFDPKARVHIVHGSNEAGKTSALAAIGDLLFGFPERTPYNFQHDSKRLRIGAVLRRPNGDNFAVRRRKARAGSLIDPDDRPIDEDCLNPLLAGVTRKDFEAEFGLTAQALRDGGLSLLRAGGHLAETLAAGSAGLTDLLRVSKEIGEEAQDLFDPGRRVSSRAFYRAFDGYDAAARKLSNSIVKSETWKEARDEEQAAIDRHRAYKDQFAELSRDLSRRERTRRTRPRLLEIAQSRVALEAFGDLPAIDGETIDAWAEALKADAEAAQTIETLAIADAEATTRIGALAIDEALLAAGPAVDTLRERIGAMREAANDRPRRVEARRAALDELEDAARRLGLGSADTLLKSMPDDATVARVRALIVDGKRGAERLDDALAELEGAEAALMQFDQVPESVLDPEPTKRRFAVFADIPRDADRLREQSAAIDLDRQRLARKAQAFDPPVASLDVLAGMPLPEPPVLGQAVKERAALDARQRDSAAALAAAIDRRRKIDAEIARLSAQGVVATRQDLLAARTLRDSVMAEWTTEAEPARRAAFFERAGETIRAVDTVTDRLLANSDLATRRELLQNQRGQAEDDCQREAATAESAREAIKTWEAGWLALWQKSGIVPLDAQTMQRWRQRVEETLDAWNGLAERRAALSGVSQKLDEHGAALRGFAKEIGVVAPLETPIDLVHKACAGALDARQAAWADARTREADRKNAGRLVRQAREKAAKAGELDRAWREAWPPALAAIRAPAHYGIVEAEAALAVWQGVPAHRTTFLREGRSIDGIDKVLKVFTHDIRQFAENLAPDLIDRDPGETVAILGQRLSAVREANKEREVLRKGLADRDRRRAPLVAGRHGFAARLTQARQRLGLAPDDDLQGAVLRLIERRTLEERLEDQLRHLSESADGKTEAELLAEQEGMDFVTLDMAIEALKQQVKTLVDRDISEAAAAQDQASQRIKTLEAGRNAQGAAQEKADAAADLVDVAERWLVRAAAAKLAGLAIESHRAQVQDPLVARASTLFSILTADAFAGLATEYDDKDGMPLLVARRGAGDNVRIEGLSEGTRDQLFLALRLALLEHRSSSVLPFVGDDLLASFDEARTARTLDCLAAFGQARQVILFTHHAHVADIARAQKHDFIEVVNFQ